ncbi:tyrosine-type recombinase/integrase [Paraburkholderia azotifigens]|uniref:tyrosine-type recombinase/integrase n=1 Tax=Paraburkholderia azotifigens TaxID=2057004 RepID=UPI003CCC5212
MPQAPLGPKSFDVIVPAMNHAINAAIRVAQEDVVRLQNDPTHAVDQIAFLLSDLRYLDSQHYRDPKFYIAAHSPIADSMRTTRTKINRPRGLGRRNYRKQDDVKSVPMPLDSFFMVLEKATNSRDEFLWTSLAGPGLRPHEALNAQCNDLDLDTGTLYVLDPRGRRFGRDITQEEHMKFKGRTHSATILIPPLRHRFYDSCARYLREWFVPYPEGTADQALFQYIEPTRRGQPYRTVTNEALNDAFQAACDAAHIPPPAGNPKLRWTLYSLRHLYGDYLTNEMKLPLEDAQIAMGHADSRSTQVYCKLNRKRASEAFEADDRARFPSGPSNLQDDRNHD